MNKKFAFRELLSLEMVRSHPSEAESIRKFCCWKTHWNWKQIKTRKASYGFLRRMAKCEKEKVFPHHFSWRLSAIAIVLAWVENPMIPQGGRQQKLIRIYLSSFPFRFACLRLPLAVPTSFVDLKIKQKSWRNLWFCFKSLSRSKFPVWSYRIVPSASLLPLIFAQAKDLIFEPRTKTNSTRLQSASEFACFFLHQLGAVEKFQLQRASNYESSLGFETFITQGGKSLFMEKKRNKRQRITTKSCLEMFLKNKK